MTTYENMPNLEKLDQYLAIGDIPAVRETLFKLEDHEQERLQAELGENAYNLLFASARRIRRGPKKGRVILIHGIMGSDLNVTRNRRTRHVWVSLWRILQGRMADLKLNLQGGPEKPDVQVDVIGQNKKVYLPMLVELNNQWEVKPFSYDWRIDIADSADRLAQVVKTFGNRKPVHLVVHSMGGLVSRYFIKRHPKLWESMKDPEGFASGGRLIMLGTPNNGSYAIPLVMSGKDKVVKMLDLVDVTHNRRQMIDILTTFHGAYQMLPSPFVTLEDDHKQLYRKHHWGSLPVYQPLLDKAAKLHRDIHPVVDTERFIYVAGYNRKTPSRIQIDRPGVFSFQTTRNGDGRVSHELGRLQGVDTYYVDEDHGSLPRNDDVMSAIHGLLAKGATDVLEPTRPSVRAEPDTTYKKADEIEIIPDEFLQLLDRETRSSDADASRLTWEEQIRAEDMLLDDYLGETPVKAEPFIPKDDEPGAKLEKRPKLTIEVVWGDFTKVEGQVYCVGHYQDVLPQYAEEALDEAISGTDDKDRQILRQHTLRGVLRGAFGDVDFYPWQTGRGPCRWVAVAGMGRPGYFGNESQRKLIRKLTWAISSLPKVKTVATVLIGSGEGTLRVKNAVNGMLKGITDALGSDNLDAEIRHLKIVEQYYGRANQIYNEVEKTLQQPWTQEHINLTLKPDVTRGEGSEVSDHGVLEMLLNQVIQIPHAERSDAAKQALDTLLKRARETGTNIRDLRQAVERIKGARENQIPCVRFSSKDDEERKEENPTRISFFRDGEDIRVAAISSTATVAERILRFDPSIVTEVAEDIRTFRESSIEDFPDFLTRLLLPRDFRELISKQAPLVFEFDRWMAQVHWEMMAQSLESSEDNLPIGINTMMARQLRTTYSPPPISSRKPNEAVRALVIGDPGDPDKKGLNLPGAKEEALAIYELLRSEGVKVDVRIGAAKVPRDKELRKIKPATRIETLHLLMKGGYDILHYAGHGDFDPKDPDRAGWLFAEGLLTARELGRIDQAPSLVVANACLSALTSQTLKGGKDVTEQRSEEALLPSLVDEFFYRGVRNYIGTAWEVNDVGAILFAKTFYKTLFENKKNKIGDAVKVARNTLYTKE